MRNSMERMSRKDGFGTSRVTGGGREAMPKKSTSKRKPKDSGDKCDYLVRREVVHILDAGLPLCFFTTKAPVYWPKGHTWVSWKDKAQATCRDCLKPFENL